MGGSTSTNTSTKIVVDSIVIVMVLVSISAVQQRSANGVPLPQAEQQRIDNLVVICSEAASQNYYYGNITTITDESILAQCDDLFVNFKNQCGEVGYSFMEECHEPAYDEYILDRGLSSRIEPEEELDQGSGSWAEEPESQTEE